MICRLNIEAMLDNYENSIDGDSGDLPPAPNAQSDDGDDTIPLVFLKRETQNMITSPTKSTKEPTTSEIYLFSY